MTEHYNSQNNKMNPTKPHLDRVKVSARINIARPSMSDGSDKIKILIVDDDARLTVFEGLMSLESFALALTGLSDQPIKGEASIATYALGKTRVYEKRSVVMPPNIPYMAESEWVEANCQEEGWFIDSYLGAQSSFTYNPADGTKTANYRVFKYVEKDPS